MKARGVLFAILGAALLAALGLLLSVNLEWADQKVWVGWQGEARTNPYLAAKRFLDRSGWVTACFHGMPMARLTGAGNAIVILPSRSRRLSPGQVAALVAFVEQGGLLLAEGAWTEEPGTAATQDLLFAAFGARAVGSRWWEKLRDQPPADMQAFQAAHRTLEVRLDGAAGAAWRVRFAPNAVLEDRSGGAAAALGDDAGVKGLVYGRGQGRAILFSDMAWMQNDAIGDHDHAAFLEALAGTAGGGTAGGGTAGGGTAGGGTAGPARIALVIREEAPSLAAWLKERAPAALAAFAALVALALWKAMPRFGPLLPDPPEARRSLLEHLAACGRFQWRLRDGQALLQAARQATLERISRVHPGWAVLAPDALCHRLAAHSGLPEERVFRALRYERHPDPQGFTEALQTLDQLRKKA